MRWAPTRSRCSASRGAGWSRWPGPPRTPTAYGRWCWSVPRRRTWPTSSAGRSAFSARLAELQRGGLVPDPLPSPQDGSCAGLTAVLPVYAADPARLPEEPPGVRCTPSTSAATYEDALDPARLAEVAAGLRALDVPAVAVAGADDVFGWLDDVVAAVPGARRIEVPDAGHLVVLEQRQAVLDAARGVLDR